MLNIFNSTILEEEIEVDKILVKKTNRTREGEYTWLNIGYFGLK